MIDSRLYTVSDWEAALNDVMALREKGIDPDMDLISKRMQDRFDGITPPPLFFTEPEVEVTEPVEEPVTVDDQCEAILTEENTAIEVTETKEMTISGDRWKRPANRLWRRFNNLADTAVGKQNVNSTLREYRQLIREVDGLTRRNKIDAAYAFTLPSVITSALERQVSDAEMKRIIVNIVGGLTIKLRESQLSNIKKVGQLACVLTGLIESVGL